MWTLSFGMWYLIPWLGIEPGPPASRAQSLSHWTTREVPRECNFNNKSQNWMCVSKLGKKQIPEVATRRIPSKQDRGRLCLGIWAAPEESSKYANIRISTRKCPRQITLHEDHSLRNSSALRVSIWVSNVPLLTMSKQASNKTGRKKTKKKIWIKWREEKHY